MNQRGTAGIKILLAVCVVLILIVGLFSGFFYEIGVYISEMFYGDSNNVILEIKNLKNKMNEQFLHLNGTQIAEIHEKLDMLQKIMPPTPTPDPSYGFKSNQVHVNSPMEIRELCKKIGISEAKFRIENDLRGDLVLPNVNYDMP